MTKTTRNITIALWGLAVLAVTAFVASGWLNLGRSAPPPTGDVLPAFDMVDQHGARLTNERLRGRAWIIGFIFTTCQGPCPLMTQKMADLQAQLPDTRIGLLSFSVDPVTDTPEVLQEYAQSYKADPSRWFFATGKPDQVTTIANAIKIGVGIEAGEIFHSTKLVLIDELGRVRGYYTQEDPQEINKLIADAKLLAGEVGRQP